MYIVLQAVFFCFFIQLKRHYFLNLAVYYKYITIVKNFINIEISKTEYFLYKCGTILLENIFIQIPPIQLINNEEMKA